MLKIGICDDNCGEMKKTCAMVEAYAACHSDDDIEIVRFDGAFSLLDYIDKHGNPDIYLLDIVMPGMNGILLGEQIRERDAEGIIILLTSSKEYGVESYRIRAKNYLLKPCTREMLFKALDNAIDSIPKDKMKSFVVNIPGGIYAVALRRILYVEYSAHRIIVHCVDGEVIESASYRKSFASITQPLLDDGRFVQVSASYIINMNHVTKLTAKEFEIIGGKKFPLSRVYVNARSIYMDYMFKE